MKLKIEGVVDSVEHETSGGFPEARVFQIESMRGGRASPVELETKPEDVVELVLDEGVSIWSSVEQLRLDLGYGPHPGDREEELVIPVRLRLAGASRGRIGDLTLKALKLFDVDPVEGTVQLVVEKIENADTKKELGPDYGLYRCEKAPSPRGSSWYGKRVAGLADLQGRGPFLIFLHGTASSTAGSFHGLAEPEQERVWGSIVRKYKEHVYCFEHRTLSQSPIENAVELASILPADAELHLVSHSRGGLIGELLCRGRIVGGRVPFDDAEIRQFRESVADECQADILTLDELGSLLEEKRFRVERFVRVACPARGTTLASGRLDRYFSMLVNLLGLTPGLRDNPLYDMATSFLMAVIEKRADPAQLPGLEAMMPESPLIKVLNRSGVELDADLTAISGHLVGSGVFGTLRSLATYFFFRENHDLAVQSGSMTGGHRRVATGSAELRGRFFFDKGGDVHHFNYFRNPKTVERLVLGLTRSDAATAGFEPIGASTEKELKTRSYGRQRGVDKPVIFLLPGIMGSHLAVDGRRAWIAPAEIAGGRMADLDIEAANVEAEELVASGYLRLTEFLSDTHEVLPFPFDWRRSLFDEARRFGAAVAEKLNQTEQPIRILAHSMGGLLARTMIGQQPEIWKALTRRDGGRLVMLGTPNGGSYVIPRVVLGREKAVRLLALLDFRNSKKAILQIVARFPGLLELLPGAGQFGPEQERGSGSSPPRGATEGCPGTRRPSKGWRSGT